MKKMQRILAIFMVMIMALAIAVPAFAVETQPSTGTITINDAVAGQEYDVYLVADLMSSSGSNYSYKAVDEWIDALKANHFSVSADGYITSNSVGTGAAAAAKNLIEYAVTNNIQPTASETATGGDGIEATASVKFENLPLGYYVIDSSMGSICFLDTVNPDVTITEKNSPPPIDKTVLDNNTGYYEYKNDSPIGAKNQFKTTITISKGAENYIVIDKMSEGLTFMGITSIIHSDGVNTTDITNNEKVKIFDDPAELTDEALEIKCKDFYGEGNYTLADFSGADFLIHFTTELLNTYKAGDTINIEYWAVLNENAVIGGEGNPNETTLVYGNNPYAHSNTSETRTYTWDAKIFKYTGENTPLAGATFKVYFPKKEGDIIVPTYLKFVSLGENVYMAYANPSYLSAEDQEKLVDEITTDETGYFKIIGLDSDNLYLEETKAPDGYNLLQHDIEMIITRSDVLGENKFTYQINGKAPATEPDADISILNGTSPLLPSTGATGTVIFVTVGGLLVVLMGMLLVVKKRMTKVTYVD